jgi:hypothetical protein
MMKHILNFLLAFAFTIQPAYGGLPPTTSKVTGDTSNVTTFNYQFPNFAGTHTGTTLSLGLLSAAGGGTGIASPGSNGNCLVSGGSTWSSSPCTTTLTVGTIGTSPNANGLFISGGVLSTQLASGTTPGMMSGTTQSVAGAFTFSTSVSSAGFYSTATHPATTGLIRLGNTDNIAWRNAANSADYTFGVNSSNVLATTLSDFSMGSGSGFLSAGNLTTPSGAGSVIEVYGNTATGNTALFTINDATNNSSATGAVKIETGNKTAGTGNSGTITLQPGTSSGGKQGLIINSGVTSFKQQTTPASGALPASGFDNVYPKSDDNLYIQTSGGTETLIGGTKVLIASGTSPERSERASVDSVCSTSPCTIAAGNSGSWLTNITRTSTGTYNVNFAASIFSAEPTCLVVPGSGNTLGSCEINGTPSTSSVPIFCKTSSTATAIDLNFYIICQGPR